MQMKTMKRRCIIDSDKRTDTIYLCIKIIQKIFIAEDTARAVSTAARDISSNASR